MWSGVLLPSRTRNKGSGQGPASSLNCSAILVLEFQSAEKESPVALPWWRGGICLLPQSEVGSTSWVERILHPATNWQSLSVLLSNRDMFYSIYFLNLFLLEYSCFLQCRVGFYCTAKWISNIHISFPFWASSCLVCHRALSRVPCSI